MSEDVFGERGRALEESFFAKRNRELLEKLRQDVTAESARDELAAASGITDPKVLDHLVSLKIGPESIIALSMVPLIEVAWADGDVDKKERQAILQAAEDSGVSRVPAARSLLENWLSEKPDPRLSVDWRQYVTALCKTLDVAAREKLRHEVMQRALKVAEAAGGILGVGSVSASEKAALSGLEAAFDVASLPDDRD